MIDDKDRDVLLRMRKSIQHTGEFTALLDRMLGWAPTVAPQLKLPARKEWDGTLHDSGGDTESADYVDGWNEALDAVEELNGTPGLLETDRVGLRSCSEESFK